LGERQLRLPFSFRRGEAFPAKNTFYSAECIQYCSAALKSVKNKITARGAVWQIIDEKEAPNEH
jgi:DNA polymerase III psi subunit